MQAQKGKDIQGIRWDKLNITRQDYRRTRIESYKNYENVQSSGDLADKVITLCFSSVLGLRLLLKNRDSLCYQECKQVERGGNFYEFRYNSRSVKPTILHFQVF